jgi:ABC-type multidrug transport system fused ATPase/permease subunit
VNEAVGRLCQSGGKKTTLTVAHRLQTIQDSEIIFAMERGKLIEQGTHTELMSRGGLYSGLVASQNNHSQ